MTAPKHLYEIVDEYEAVMQAIEEAEGELTPELAAQLDAIPGQFKSKAERVALYIRNLVTLAEGAAAEAIRLKALVTQRENAATRLKDYLKRNMEAMGETKIETPLVKLRIQKNSRPAISLKDGADIPGDFQRITVSLDGAKVYEAYKAGTPLPEFNVEHGTHLRLS